MVKKARSTQRREESLSRDRIIEASIALLDSSGESGLTFRALSERLATGPGAIYWHIASKSDLLTAACDAIVARTMNAPCGRRDAESNHSRARAGHVRRDRRASVGWLSADTCPRAVADGAHPRTHRPAGARSWRAGRRTVGNGVRVAELHPWRRGQNAANTHFARSKASIDPTF
jgi:AcrR family transcriptional regulator